MKWTDTEDKKYRKALINNKNKTYEEISEMFGNERTPTSIRHRNNRYWRISRETSYNLKGNENPLWKYGRKESMRRAWKKWRKNNREKDNQRLYKLKKEKNKWYKNYKKKFQCKRCGESHPACIEFHHIKEKLENIGAMISKGYSKENIIKEIEKCDALCSNCHKKEHWNNGSMV